MSGTPWLDVTAVLLDPMFASTFPVMRRAAAVGDDGFNVITPVMMEAVGVVTPEGSNLDRGADQQNMPRRLSVITKFRLFGPAQSKAGQGYQPDIVIFNGDQYVVTAIDDLTVYGPGFIEATCESIDTIDTPPSFKPGALGQCDFSNPRNSGIIPCF